MYFRILRRDVKRKKTMNFILLLFTILASTFVSSGLSNVVNVMSGTDYYFEQAGLGDYIIITQNGDGKVEKILENSKEVTGYKKEECCWASKDDLTANGHKVEMKNNTFLIQPLQENGLSYFNEDNTKLTHVDQGKIYVTAGFLKDNNIEVGDTLRLTFNQKTFTFDIAGEIKDALLGSVMMGNTRFIISNKDYERYTSDSKIKDYKGCIYNIDTDDVKILINDIADVEGVLFADGKDVIKICYIMEMIVAMIVLILSVCLIIVSFVLLKFVIAFSISEEYREIGVMKAIGISNFKIRSLYMIKYLVMALLGGLLGFLIGIPFGNILIQSVSKKMILGNEFGVLLNVTGSVFVVIIMSFFAYLCTGKIKKVTPVDAIRSGQTGERYDKKMMFPLRKSVLGNAVYMAVNDVVSSPRRFFTIIISFFLCSVFVFGLVEVTDTMKSDRLINTFGKKSDVYITDPKLMKLDFMSEEGNDESKKVYEGIEKDLKKMGIPGKVSMEVWYKYSVLFNNTETSMTFEQNKELSASEYEYTEGSAPLNVNEVAITPQIASQLDAHIGDTITINFGKDKKDCMIVGYFQTMNQLGKVIRLHEDAPTNMANASAMMAFQIDFDEKVSRKELEHRIEKIKDYYDIEDVFDAAGYCVDCMGVADTMDAVSKLLLLITCIVVSLVTVLMERSFIQEEVNQIALLKAIGFKDGFVIKWHTIRFMIVTVIAEILAIFLTYPVTKLWCDPIWSKMGAQNVEYYFKPFSLLVVYPGIILTINLSVVFVTSLHTKKITSRDIANIE